MFQANDYYSKSVFDNYTIALNITGGSEKIITKSEIKT